VAKLTQFPLCCAKLIPIRQTPRPDSERALDRSCLPRVPSSISVHGSLIAQTLLRSTSAALRMAGRRSFERVRRRIARSFRCGDSPQNAMTRPRAPKSRSLDYCPRWNNASEKARIDTRDCAYLRSRHCNGEYPLAGDAKRKEQKCKQVFPSDGRTSGDHACHAGGGRFLC